MLGDPGRAMWISVTIAGAAAVWLLAQWVSHDSFFDVLSYALYAIDLVALLVLITGIAAALFLALFARVKADLLAGRNVVGQWQVTADELKSFAPAALDLDRTDKRGALVLITAMVVLIFGAFALFDPEVAPAMLSIGAVVLLLVGGAYLLSGRIARRHLSFRSGEVIVGRDGLLVNGVLHVWSVPLSWLVGAALDPGAMTVTYAHFIRYGVQTVDVLLPVPHGAQEDAQKVLSALQTR